MRATARRLQGHHHEVEVDDHVVVVDEPTEAGGTDAGPSPTRLLAASLASCTAITIGMYTERKGWDIDGLEVAVDFDGPPRGDEKPEFVVTLGLPDGLDGEQASRIEAIAAKCPVHRVLAGGARVEIRTGSAAG